MDTPPHNLLLGPVFERGDPCGLVAVDGKIECSWGDINRADMTFSVTKTYLALLVGVAVDQALISSVDQTVCDTLQHHGKSTEGFNDPHNKQISWRQFLQFTSEWSGECFGVPDQVDHNRVVGMQPITANDAKGVYRQLSAPGTYWEYNDVRINQCSLALMRLFGCSIPDVFGQHIMQAVGASDSWSWHGYDNSWVVLENGSRVQSVPGGGHWGGGVVISAGDQLLLAQLMMNGGVAGGQSIISREWIEQMLTPCDIAPWYGYFTWLNKNKAVSSAASEESYFCLGIGGQLVWHDPAAKLIAVFRWIDADHTETFIRTTAEIVSAL